MGIDYFLIKVDLVMKIAEDRFGGDIDKADDFWNEHFERDYRKYWLSKPTHEDTFREFYEIMRDKLDK